MVKVKTDLEKLSGGLWLEGKYKSGNLQNPLITIITTTFNSSKTISETFESILHKNIII